VEGVEEVVVGYAGGKEKNPTYRTIKDHTEALRIIFNPQVISFEGLLDLFQKEMGGLPSFPGYSRQYRSAILTHTPEQTAAVAEMVEAGRAKGRKVFLDVEPATPFYR
jgi:peptide methionine sulfoxide reductase MsrA